MRILFLWPSRLRKDLGGPKIVLELAEAMRVFGWEPTLYDPWTLPEPADQSLPWAERCRTYLRAHAQEFDVIDYDHGHLPYPREVFPPQTLMVARSGLLSHHFVKTKIPDLYPFRDGLRRLLKGRGPQERYAENCRLAHRACQEADLINVSNEDDKKVLSEQGIEPDKIGVFPFGMNAERRAQFSVCSENVPAEPRVAFVGSFDSRKGAFEFPRLVARVAAQIPKVEFHLLGTKGRFQTDEEVRRYFPEKLRARLVVVSHYGPDDLPNLLSTCSVGVFPSHIEGFGFGVLEMLAASLPVIAYQAPGPPMMLPLEYLVPRGDADRMADKVVALLRNPVELLAARRWAGRRPDDFKWEKIAEGTSSLYLQRWQRLQKGR